MTSPKCDRTGCAHFAQYAPVLNVPWKKTSPDQVEPLQAMLGLRLCERHAVEIKASEFKDMQVIIESHAAAISPAEIEFERAHFSKVVLGSDAWKKLDQGA